MGSEEELVAFFLFEGVVVLLHFDEEFVADLELAFHFFTSVEHGVYDGVLLSTGVPHCVSEVDACDDLLEFVLNEGMGTGLRSSSSRYWSWYFLESMKESSSSILVLSPVWVCCI